MCRQQSGTYEKGKSGRLTTCLSRVALRVKSDPTLIYRTGSPCSKVLKFIFSLMILLVAQLMQLQVFSKEQPLKLHLCVCVFGVGLCACHCVHVEVRKLSGASSLLLAYGAQWSTQASRTGSLAEPQPHTS